MRWARWTAAKIWILSRYFDLIRKSVFIVGCISLQESAVKTDLQLSTKKC